MLTHIPTLFPALQISFVIIIDFIDATSYLDFFCDADGNYSCPTGVPNKQCKYFLC